MDADDKRVYGYRVPNKYLKGKAKELGVWKDDVPASKHPLNWVPDTAMLLLNLAGLSRASSFGTVYIDKTMTDTEHVLILASNDPRDGLPRRPPPQEAINRLKEVLGTVREPRWYIAAT
jgi:hypothetical protein